MDEQSIIAQLNQNRKVKLFKPNTVEVNILHTLRIATSDTKYYLPFLSVVYVPSEEKYYSINHKNIPNFYENIPNDSFGEGYIRAEIDKELAENLVTAIETTISYFNKNPSIQTFSFLCGVMKGFNFDLAASGLVRM